MAEHIDVAELRRLLEARALPWVVNGPRECCPDDPECPWNGGFGGIDDASGEEVISWSQAVEITDKTTELIVAAVNALPTLLDALERAERVEAAARLAYEFLTQEDYECRARTELRAVLAPVPGPAAEEES